MINTYTFICKNLSKQNSVSKEKHKELYFYHKYKRFISKLWCLKVGICCSFSIQIDKELEFDLHLLSNISKITAYYSIAWMTCNTEIKHKNKLNMRFPLSRKV